MCCRVINTLYMFVLKSEEKLSAQKCICVCVCVHADEVMTISDSEEEEVVILNDEAQ